MARGFIRSPDGTFLIIDAPGATTIPGNFQGTKATSVNLQGVVAGQYQDTTGGNHGFVWNPPATRKISLFPI